MYKLLKDKSNEFQCEIKLEGTSAKDAKVRLFLEADGCEYAFNGRIQDNKCTITLGKLKKYENLLESGKIRLEVIAEDTVFTPYENTYTLEESKKVTVEVVQPDTQAKKPMVEVKVEEPVQVQQPTPAPKVVKPVQKVQKKDPIAELKKYLSEQTYFTGTLQSFKTVIKQPRHRNYFNTICEANKLDKKVVLKQILS